MHSFLSQAIKLSDDKDIGFRYVSNVLNKMDNIRFAEDYGKMSKNEKSKWLAQTYLKAFPDTEGSISVVPKDSMEAFEKWKATFGHTTLARNRLRDLFCLVRRVYPFSASV